MMIRHISFSGLAALIAATLVGCAVGPDYRPPETKAPSTWDGQNAVTPAHSQQDHHQSGDVGGMVDRL